MTVRQFRWTVPLLLGLAFLAGKGWIENSLSASHRATPLVTIESARFFSRSIHKFSLGFDNLIADLAWVQLLQEAKLEPLESPGVSWEYAMIHAINTLDPGFKKAYWFGASFVSIFRRDKIGALDILEKWTQVEPRSWNSHYLLGFHLFHEMDRPEPAASELLKAAGLPGAPSYLGALGIRLLSESGAQFSALQSAVQVYETVTDVEGRYRLSRRIRSLNYNLQKAALAEGIRQYRLRYKREPAALGDLNTLAKSAIDYTPMVHRMNAPKELEPLLAEKFQFRYDPQTQAILGVLRPEDQFLDQAGIYHDQKETSE